MTHDDHTSWQPPHSASPMPPTAPPPVHPSGAAPMGYPVQPPYGWQPPAPSHGGARPVGPIVMILGAILTVVSTFLPWNHARTAIVTDSGYTYVDGEPWSGWDLIGIDTHAGRSYGTLMLIAFIVAIVASATVIATAIGALVTGSNNAVFGVLALVGALIGLVATLGVLIGYLSLGAMDEAHFPLWIYSFAFVPVLVGSIGVLSKKF